MDREPHQTRAIHSIVEPWRLPGSARSPSLRSRGDILPPEAETSEVRCQSDSGQSLMYRNRVVNVGIVLGAIVLGGTALYLSRSQVLVDDESYMKAMIPHHSIAILTSERAGIEDVRVRELADGIAATQRKEIKEMDWLVQDIEENGPATTKEEADARPVPDFQGSASTLPDAQWSAREFLRALLALPLPKELGQQ